MGDVVIDGMLVAHDGSGHAAPGPPAVSGIMPPTTPSGQPFTPAPFMYIAKTSRLHSPTATKRTIDGSQHKFAQKGMVMDIAHPGNMPSKPLENTPPNGSDLVYSTYLGSGITGMALDAHGNVFVVGFARNDFPTTAGAYRETTTKPTDSFVVKLDATGSTLLYGTFLGASYLGGSAAASIAVDEAGAAYITGGTSSADYPLTPGASAGTDNAPRQLGPPACIA